MSFFARWCALTYRASIAANLSDHAANQRHNAASRADICRVERLGMSFKRHER